MNDEQLEKRMLQLLEEAGMSQNVYWRAYARGQLRLLRKLSQKQSRPVAGFPFSLIEQFLNGVLDLISRAVDRLVRRIERQFR